jgi:hypothetical protein
MCSKQRQNEDGLIIATRNAIVKVCRANSKSTLVAAEYFEGVGLPRVGDGGTQMAPESKQSEVGLFKLEDAIS